MATRNRTLDEFWSNLDESRADTVREIRAIILNAEPALQEQIKWNAPSYAINGQDCITFNLAAPNSVRVVLHAGTNRKENKRGASLFEDDTGLWHGNQTSGH